MSFSYLTFFLQFQTLLHICIAHKMFTFQLYLHVDVV